MSLIHDVDVCLSFSVPASFEVMPCEVVLTVE